MTQYFLCPNILSANKQILNSHITWCPKITVLNNPQGGGGGRVFISGPWTTYKEMLNHDLCDDVPRVPSKHETLAHRLRRWPNISPALGQRIVFAGLVC